MAIKQTQNDLDALKKLPEEWFRAEFQYRVERSEWRCERLEQFGYLETDSVGFIVQYKKTQKAQGI